MAGALRALERDAGHLASTSSSSSSSSSRRREVPCVLMDRSDRALPYEVVWEEQKRLVESKCRELDREDRCARQDVLLVQHEPVYTLGAGSTTENLLFDEEDPPLPLYRTERGGEVTYHGPGQLVLYPVSPLDRHVPTRRPTDATRRPLSLSLSLSLNDVLCATPRPRARPDSGPQELRAGPPLVSPPSAPSYQSFACSPRSLASSLAVRYMRSLEEVALQVLLSFGVEGHRVEGLTGVWVGDAKVAALGVRGRRWVTYHGLAINVCCDLGPFEDIVPCGIQGRRVTSLAEVLAEKGGAIVWGSEEELLKEAAARMADSFERVFGVDLHRQKG